MAIDYDPRKAHEYYMKHRKLKGRRSTKGFSQQKKEQLSYAKQQLREQKQQRDEQNREDINSRKKAAIERLNEAKRKQKEQLTAQAEAKIASLRESIALLPKEQKAVMREKVNAAVADVKDMLSKKKQEISDNTSDAKEAIHETASAERTKARADSKAKYERDLDKAYKRIKSGKK